MLSFVQLPAPAYASRSFKPSKRVELLPAGPSHRPPQECRYVFAEADRRILSAVRRTLACLGRRRRRLLSWRRRSGNARSLGAARVLAAPSARCPLGAKAV